MMKQMQDQMTKTATTKQPNMGLPEGKFGVNNIIFVQDMPAEVDEKMLSCLFEQFNGFIEVRMAPARPGAGKVFFWLIIITVPDPLKHIFNFQILTL